MDLGVATRIFEAVSLASFHDSVHMGPFAAVDLDHVDA